MKNNSCSTLLLVFLCAYFSPSVHGMKDIWTGSFWSRTPPAQLVQAARLAGMPFQPEEVGTTPLHLAVIDGDINEVVKLIDKGAEINGQDRQGNTPLHLAAQMGSLDIAKKLIEKGASMLIKNGGFMDPLEYANNHGQTEIVAFFKDLKKGTPLHEAVMEGDLNKVIELINQGADVNAANSDGNTPLHIAAGLGFTDIIRELIEHGAFIILANKEGRDPLDYAIKNNQGEASALLRYYIGLYIPTEHFATLISEYTMPLIEDWVDEAGNTPLHLAVMRGDIANVAILIGKGANLNALNGMMNTPLHLAIDSGFFRIIEMLVYGGANLEVLNGHDETPLEYAIKKGKTDIADFLAQRAKGNS